MEIDALSVKVAEKLRYRENPAGVRWVNDSVAQLIGEPAAVDGFTSLPQLRAEMPRTIDLSVPEKFLYYAQFLWAYGGAAPREELFRGRKVVLSLRTATDATLNHGRGTYDDRFVILWRSLKDGWTVRELAANTEPSAQYDHGASPELRAGFRRMRGVAYTKPEGEDINDDRVRDLGRLEPGVYRFGVETTKLKSPLDRYFRVVVPPAKRSGNLVMRDINHNGRFDDGESGLDNLNNSFLIHKGGENNTWSAGCQTLPEAAPTGTGAAYRSDLSPWGVFWETMCRQQSLTYVLVDIKMPTLTRSNSGHS